MSLGEFRRGASQLARNPLGILALFLLLVYGIAALVLGVAGHRVDPDERRALILFLVFFPLLVLVAFYRLVTKHHAKLYAPSDYDDERLFLRSLTPTEQMRRIHEELEEVGHEEDTVTEPEPLPSEDAGASEEMAALPPAPHPSDFLMAKELALRQLEREIGRRLDRDVALSSGRGDLVLDGVSDSGNELITVQVKFLATPSTRFQEGAAVIQRVLDILHVVHRSRPHVTVHPYLLLVFRSLNGVDRREVENRYRELEHVDGLQVRVYELSTLAGLALNARIRDAEITRDLEDLTP